MTEAELQAAVLKLARLYGWRTYHTHDSRHSARGFPDLVLLRQHRLLFLELKTTKGPLSDAQADWLDDLNRVPGILAWLVRPDDLQLVADILSGKAWPA